MLKQRKITERLGIGMLTILIMLMIVSLSRAQSVVYDPGGNRVNSSKDERFIPPRRFAVLIGIDRYQDERLSPLSYCKSDTLALKEALFTCGFDEHDIFMLTDDAEDASLIPTKSNIQNVLEKLKGVTDEKNDIVVYFSGHAGTFEGVPMLLPMDFDSKRPITTGLVLEDLFTSLKRCEANSRWILLDAQPFDNHVNKKEQMIFPSRTVLFYAAKPDIRAYETQEHEGGMFTYHVINGLLGEADWHGDSNGKVDFAELYLYVKAQLAKNKEDRSMVPGLILSNDIDDLFSYEISAVKKTQQTHDDPQRVIAIGYAKSSIAYLEKGEYKKAIEEIDKALKLFPDDSGFLHTKRTIETASKPQPPRQEVNKPGQAGKAGERKVLTIKGVEYPFRWCPAGTFMMGSPDGELGRFSRETQHQVTLTQGFWMLETEVTQEMWESVRGNNPSYFKGGKKLPVEQVSWKDCQDYIQELNAMNSAPKGYKFSLPTEAQWEYACRAGTTTALNHGKNLTSEDRVCSNLDEAGWYDENSVRSTHEVGRKKPNAWFLYDMHGNVWEWCLDWYTTYPDGNVTDPVEASTGSSHVFRGGSWGNVAGFCRSAYRDNSMPARRHNRLGFRLSLVHE